MTLLGHWTRQIAFSSVAAMALAAGTAAQANSHDDSFTIAVLPDTQNYIDYTHQKVEGFPYNVLEADHGKLKMLIKPVRGFKSMPTAYATIKGFEVMRALRKGQAQAWCLQPGIMGEVRLVERAFGIGPSALTETMIMLNKHFANAA